ncbi:YraN family protein [Archangium violaceum]|uniref:YraN family protein n=1 Tax=Archangium violaceum TaxID=83451 RepID=UPI00193BBA95|nr:YraN family protein [Archangium violaceum]QRK06149.1 YraN family protein [Archangium violaceum]
MGRGGAAVDRKEYGDEGEEVAVRFLEQQGYRVRARNYSCRHGELDVVAEHGETLCFVEVRMRSTAVWGDPSHTVSFSKQRKVVKAALHYLAVHRLRDRMLRFDVISVVGRGERATVEHLPGAFDAGM